MQLAVNRSPETPRPSSAGHAHLWSLPDGTGLHAPLGLLFVEQDTGLVCCHLCGRWWVSPGAHVRVHGHTAMSYREAMGLGRTAVLAAEQLSSAIGRRQQQRYTRDPQMREHLEFGQALARSGQLTWRARAANVADAQSPGRRASRHGQLQAGRDTQAAARQVALDERVGDLGAEDLPGLLRSAYEHGASLTSLARSTGLGRASLRQALADAGIELRSSGVNTAAGKRARATAADRAAAARLGVDDLYLWLGERHAQGWSLVRLAAAVGHSTHWVRWRLNEAPPAAGAAAPTLAAANGQR